MLRKRSPIIDDVDQAECLKNIRDRHDGDSTSEGSLTESDCIEYSNEQDILDGKSLRDKESLSDEQLTICSSEVDRLLPWVNKLIEDSELLWLNSANEAITLEIRNLLYIVGCSMVGKNICILPLPCLPNEEFINKFKIALNNKVIKRKDQKLRMVYGGLIKSLFKKAADNKSRHPRKISFIKKYADSEPNLLQKHIEACRTPSKKKLIDFFLAYPKIYSESVELVQSGHCFKTFLYKQKRRMKIIVKAFLGSYPDCEENLDNLREKMKETLAHLPWSTDEVNSSILDLTHIFKEVEIWRKIQLC